MSPDDPRAAVVATAKAMLAEGLVSGSEGNVSVREGELVHITPRDLPYEGMSVEDLVTLDLGGRRIAGEREPSSERAVHLAVYAARADVAAVVHTHSPRATEWSARAEDLDHFRTSTYAEPGSTALAEAVVAALGRRDAALMARHGVVAVGSSPAAALDVARGVERRARLAM